MRVRELDPGFGNHPALLVLARHGRSLPGAPELFFPDDSGGRRTVDRVERIEIAVAVTGPVDAPDGAIMIRSGAIRSGTSGRHGALVSAGVLAALPQHTRTVSYLSGSGQQIHVETGRTLSAVLRVARIRLAPATTVAHGAVTSATSLL